MIAAISLLLLSLFANNVQCQLPGKCYRELAVALETTDFISLVVGVLAFASEYTSGSHQLFNPIVSVVGGLS
jgi:hypothetical protein